MHKKKKEKNYYEKSLIVFDQNFILHFYPISFIHKYSNSY